MIALNEDVGFNLLQGGVCIIACLGIQKTLTSSHKISGFAPASFHSSLVSMYLLVYVGSCGWVSENNLQELLLFFRHTDPGLEVRSSALAAKHLYPLSHLAITLPHFLRSTFFS